MTIDVGSVGSQPTFDELLGEAVHQVLWRRKIRQTEFAMRVLGITQSAFSRKLRGVRPFSAEELSLVADDLGVDLNTLTPRKNPPPNGDGPAASGPKISATAPTPFVCDWPKLRAIDSNADAA